VKQKGVFLKDNLKQMKSNL